MPKVKLSLSSGWSFQISWAPDQLIYLQIALPNSLLWRTHPQAHTMLAWHLLKGTIMGAEQAFLPSTIHCIVRARRKPTCSYYKKHCKDMDEKQRPLSSCPLRQIFFYHNRIQIVLKKESLKVFSVNGDNTQRYTNGNIIIIFSCTLLACGTTTVTIFQIIALTLIPSCCSLFLFVQDKTEKKQKEPGDFCQTAGGREPGVPPPCLERKEMEK